MKHDGYTAIGSFLNTHGYKGKLSVFLTLKNNKDLKFPESIFVDIQQTLVPFFIEERTAPQNNRIVIKIADINTEESALPFKKKEIFVTDVFFKEFIAKGNTPLSLIGFEVYDKVFGLIGILEDILEYPGQEIFKIRGLSKEEILIPYNDNFVKKINKVKKSISVVTPEGLLELYLKREEKE